MDPGATPLEFSTASGHIVLGGATGTVRCHLLGDDTGGIPYKHLRYRLMFTDSMGVELPFLRGPLGLLREDQ